MYSPQQFIGKWNFLYWLELGESTQLTIEENGIAHTEIGTAYNWEALSDNGIHIFIEGYVDYVGFLKNGAIKGQATSDYSMNQWTWQATRWNGPTIYPINNTDIVQKRWEVINETDELENFKVSFINNDFVETSPGKREKWHIENGELVFTHAKGFITYRAKNTDGIIKGHAKNLVCFEWKFTLNFIENISVRAPQKIITPQPVVSAKKIKDDKARFIQYLKDNNVECFYHFTDMGNIPFIKKHGGLFSWSYISKNGLSVAKQGGDELSRTLDKKYGLENYVRLSFCKDHPMAYVCKTKRNMNLVLLKVKVDVVELSETRFSNMNATSNNHQEGTSFEDLLRIDIAATRKNHLRKDDADFGLHQAEVMVKQHIPIEYILNINNPEKI